MLEIEHHLLVEFYGVGYQARLCALEDIKEQVILEVGDSHLFDALDSETGVEWIQVLFSLL